MDPEEGGSFRDLRELHLTLFDESLHRHDRGWPHVSEPDESHRDKVKERRSHSERGILLKG